MAGRGILEQCVINDLVRRGWNDPPSMRLQAKLFPGVTPVQAKPGGKGRQAPVIDTERREQIGGEAVAYTCGIKAAKTRKTTVTVTTGRGDTHVEAVLSAAEAGRDIPVVVVAFPGAKHAGSGEDAELIEANRIEACVVNVGPLVRACPVDSEGRRQLPRATKGQGKGRGKASPVAWTDKCQRSKAGKEYWYISIQCNLIESNAQWQTFDSMDALAAFIQENEEGIML